MRAPNAATPAPVGSGNERQEFATATSRISHSANPHRSPENSLFATTAREYRPAHMHPDPTNGVLASELTQCMMRAFICEAREKVCYIAECGSSDFWASNTFRERFAFWRNDSWTCIARPTTPSLKTNQLVQPRAIAFAKARWARG